MSAANFVIIPHRGNKSQAPENTAHSFDLAMDQGFDSIEFDVQLSKDGIPLVIHDEDLGRTTEVYEKEDKGDNALLVKAKGRVADTDSTEIRKMDAGMWFSFVFANTRVPLLSEVLERYGPKAHLHLELKSKQAALPAAVFKELSAAGMVPSEGTDPAAGPAFNAPGLTITSFHLDQLKRSRQLLPGVRHGWLVQEMTDEVIKEASDAGLQGLYPRTNILTPEAVARATAAGFSVRTWGIKDLALLERAVECGAAGATVDWPDKGREHLFKMYMKQVAEQKANAAPSS